MPDYGNIRKDSAGIIVGATPAFTRSPATRQTPPAQAREDRERGWLGNDDLRVPKD